MKGYTPPTVPDNPTTGTNGSKAKSRTDPCQIDPGLAQCPSLYTPPSPSTALRVVEIAAGAFLVVGGVLVIATGVGIGAAAVIELGGGEITGPFYPLVAGHAVMALAISMFTTTIGVFITSVGGYLIYAGATGQNPVEQYFNILKFIA